MGIFNKKIAIDLGSSNFRVYSPKQGVIMDEPSLVAYKRGTSKVSSIGFEAKDAWGRENKTTKIVHPIKRGVIAHVGSTENLLKYALKQASGPFYLAQPEAMISISSSATSAETRALIDTARRSGIGTVHLIETPVAAALGAALPIIEPRGYMVIDLGSGTTEIAVFSLGGIVHSSTVRHGGDDINKYLIQQFRINHDLVIGKSVVEELKIKHGFIGSSKAKKTINITGVSKSTSSPKTISISAAELSRYIERSLAKVTTTLKQAFEHIPADLVSDITTSGIALTGGGANLSGIAKYLSKKVNVQCYVVPNPSQCVIRGAHISLSHLDQYKKSQLSKV